MATKSDNEEGQVDDTDTIIPDDFFDDFLKEDFMAGLDIVDEATEPPQKPKIDHVKKFRLSPPGNQKKRKKSAKYDQELKKLNKELDKIKKTAKKPNKTESDHFDIRRDPEKTRQAIQLDKIKSAKDKEKRIITDIVQTGLVPPGMELEVDIKDIQEDTTKFDLRNKIRKKSRSKTPEKRVIRPRRSPLYRPKPSRSPVRRPIIHSRSPRRRSLRRRSRSRSFTRFRRSRSNSYRRWRRRSRTRSRSRSIKRTKKESFIEEIVAKLNAAPVYNYPPVAEPYYPPAPPPPPQSDPYDESFFIGAPMAQVRAQDDDKLFADSRIKLSEFLAITVKPQVNKESTASLQGKIQVIQRCQDAARIIKEKTFSGPLTVTKVTSHSQEQDTTESPLLRKPLVQLPYTTGTKSVQPSFAARCQMLLKRVGVAPRPITPRAAPKIKLVEPPPPLEVIHPPTPPKAKTVSYGVQTDKELSACKACLHRQQKLYANSAVQCGDNTMTFSVSTQVTEADFYSMIPRNQSLASLTPAQLLGKQSMLRAVPSPPPPPPLMGFPFPGFGPGRVGYPETDGRRSGFQRF